MSVQIEKQQFKNNTGGWLGVVLINPKGEDVGGTVAPGGYIWLSEQEQVLTANAPRDPKDNPFIEQTLIRTNRETGAAEDYVVVPLTPSSEERYVPASGRHVPGLLAGGAAGTARAQAAATGDAPEFATQAEMGALERHAQVSANPGLKPNEPAPVGSPSMVDAIEEQDDAPPPPSRAAEAAQAAQAPVEEETAAEVPEETGAATMPPGQAPEGEYARAEEVGTPVQEQTGSDSEQRTQPAPFTPDEG